jgi:vacuolar-type H+-ATPase subunit F/Vma7
MPAVRVLCRPAAAAGFALAGLAAHEVPEGADARAVVESALAGGEPGVVLLEEGLYDELSEDVRALMDRSANPVVIPFPGPGWGVTHPAEERVVELLRRAIGYRVRLR